MEGEIRKYESSSYAPTGPGAPTKLAIARRQLPYRVTQLAEKKVIEKLIGCQDIKGSGRARVGNYCNPSECRFWF
jgi:hypothetical protein